MSENYLTGILILLLVISVPVLTFPGASTESGIANGQIKHVVIIVEENEDYNAIVNSSEAPYQNQLIKHYALAADYFAVEHPSLPNYLDLTGGTDGGITSDCSPSPNCIVSGNNSNIADLLNASGLTWKEYAESMPSPCYESNSGNYAVRHNPFVYYTDITKNQLYCDQRIVPMNISDGSGLFNDLKSGNLPNFSFVTPNVCSDGHDSCDSSTTQVRQIDNWLSVVVPKIINSSSFSATALFIVYDEANTSPSNQVACILVSPFAKSGYISHVQYTHYSLLATVESIFGLPSLGRGDNTSPMYDVFVGSDNGNTQSSTISSVTVSSQARNEIFSKDLIYAGIASIILVATTAYVALKKRMRFFNA